MTDDRKHWLMRGDCLERTKEIPDGSVDAIVTDPPYGLAFMGKKWDYDVPSVAIWAECLRVLKPGGHLLAFAGTRTQHRMACRIEDAGFEIRDMIAWVYGSGFPKSLDVSKAIDKAAGAAREVIEQVRVKSGGMEHVNRTNATAHGYRPDGYQKGENVLDITVPATDAARQWEGWGTALKPALEPITVARKPFIGTVAENVQAFGTGALNIGGCRVETSDNLNGEAYSEERKPSTSEWVAHGGTIHNSTGETYKQPTGRWPANFIHDGSEEVVGLFPTTTSGKPCGVKAGNNNNVFGQFAGGIPVTGFGDTGSAARFFYCPKASKQDRDEGLEGHADKILAMSNQAKAELERGNMHEGKSGMNSAKVRKNNHPTVKPTDLMRYLCRLVTPKNGTVLDPFNGSGSTGKGAVLEDFSYVGIEREAEHVKTSIARIEYAVEYRKRELEEIRLASSQLTLAI